VSVGTVTALPTVSVAGPTNGQLFAAPATIPLRASVTGGSGTATVQYYNGTTLIGSSSTGPSYPFDWPNVAAGDYTVKAKVIDANTDTAESTPVAFSVRPANAATFVSQTVPSSMAAGASYLVTVVMKNTGAATWTAATKYELGSVGPVNNTTWGRSRAQLAAAASVAPNAQYSFQFNVTAPTTPGTYNFQWQMVRDNAESFGATSVPLNIVVAGAPSVSMTQPAAGSIYAAPATVQLRANVTGGSGGFTVQYYNGATLIGSSSAAPSYPIDWPNVPIGDYSIKAKAVDANTATAESLPVAVNVRAKNAAVFVSQTVPTAMTAGKTYPATIVMKNTGAATWTSAAPQYRLGSQAPQDNLNWGLARVAVPVNIAPDGSATFQFAVTAPSAAGNHTFQWRMIQDGVEWFGAMTTPVTVAVSAAANPAPTISSITPPSRTAGSGAFTLTVNGSNFVAGSAVTFNGAARQTTLVNASQLTAAMLASDAQTAGAFGIAVINPSPGGGTSNTATLTVDASPTVTIASPANGVALTTPVEMTITASTTGSISKVEFFQDATLLGTDTVAPYSVVWSNVVPGTYALTAKATAASGTVVQSAAASVGVTSNTLMNTTGIYRASTDFSAKQGRANWYYLDWNGAPMSFIAAEGVWRMGQNKILTPTGGSPGATTDSVRQWVAPIAGTIRISGNASDANTTCGNGAVVLIKRGAQILWQQTLDNVPTAFSYDLTTAIPAGEAINFVINGRGDHLCDVTNFDPTITYVSPWTPYRASTDFSSSQGQAHWYYLNSSGAPMTYAPAEGLWRGSEQYNLLWTSGGHPGVGVDAVRQWVAPLAGTVRITGSASDGNVGCGDGQVVFIKRGTQILWQQTLENVSTIFNYDLRLAVSAGDAISFAINSRSGNTLCDSTNFDPTVTYVPPSSTYRASADYASSQGQSNWNYLNSTGVPMTYFPAEGLWRGSQQYNLLWSNGGHPGVGLDAVRQWVAPAKGTIRISGSAFDADVSCGDGQAVLIKKGTQVLWQQTLANVSTSFPYDMTVAVAAGDAISFVINSRSSDTRCDSTYFDPAVAYVTTYRPSVDFSSSQGQANWYYLSSSGVPMTYVAAENRWRGEEQLQTLWAVGGHPGANIDAVRQWQAPLSGNVRVSGNVSDANVTCGNGVIVSIRKGAQVLWQQTLENGNTTGFPVDLTVSVLPGDLINFVINSRGGDLTCDATTFDPIVQYVAPQ
jgi:hypothetical protein